MPARLSANDRGCQECDHAPKNSLNPPPPAASPLDHPESIFSAVAGVDKTTVIAGKRGRNPSVIQKS